LHRRIDEGRGESLNKRCMRWMDVVL